MYSSVARVGGENAAREVDAGGTRSRWGWRQSGRHPAIQRLRTVTEKYKEGKLKDKLEVKKISSIMRKVKEAMKSKAVS
ncbi:hypothetical protein KQX54_006262 [Cotesia glomerata]|uniref:Uncharacterized protein n=1 Tax=Cotesia glomerata TaxID=32391 RepID=A0AAV7IY01_COTGL|nr:hypothetical protein KQX54_006262 [Cotesia glomerata]